MCGYVGMFLNDNFNIEHLRLMSKAIINRGPDDSGEYFDLNKLIGFIIIWIAVAIYLHDLKKNQ